MRKVAQIAQQRSASHKGANSTPIPLEHQSDSNTVEGEVLVDQTHCTEHTTQYAQPTTSAKIVKVQGGYYQCSNKGNICEEPGKRNRAALIPHIKNVELKNC